MLHKPPDTNTRLGIMMHRTRNSVISKETQIVSDESRSSTLQTLNYTELLLCWASPGVQAGRHHGDGSWSIHVLPGPPGWSLRPCTEHFLCAGHAADTRHGLQPVIPTTAPQARYRSPHTADGETEVQRRQATVYTDSRRLTQLRAPGNVLSAGDTGIKWHKEPSSYAVKILPGRTDSI